MCRLAVRRVSVPDALALVAQSGPTLPVFLVLEKMASGYPALQFGVWGPLGALTVATVCLVAVWWPELRAPAGRRPA